MGKKPTHAPDRMIELNLSVNMIEEVFAEYERENPGRTHLAMSPDDMADRIMAKVMASAKYITQ